MKVRPINFIATVICSIAVIVAVIAGSFVWAIVNLCLAIFNAYFSFYNDKQKGGGE